MLQTKPSPALLRGGHVATFTLPARGILHRVRLIENNHAVEIGAQPFHDLFDTRNLLVARVGTQRGIGGEKDALLQTDRCALSEPRERSDEKPFQSEC